MRSAGLLMYRVALAELEVLLAHPGGPYFSKKDEGWWTVPKGLVEGDEDPLTAARREFTEETAHPTPEDGYLPLGEVRQKSGKAVVAWAFEGDCDAALLVPNTFEVEWPPRSGRAQAFPEVDRCAWFGLAEARRRINAAQAAFLDALSEARGA